MGKKHSQKKKAYVYSEDYQSEESDNSFAAKLLSSMGIHEDHNNGDMKDTTNEEEIDDENGEIKHPHLHHLHESFKSMFKRETKPESADTEHDCPTTEPADGKSTDCDEKFKDCKSIDRSTTDGKATDGKATDRKAKDCDCPDDQHSNAESGPIHENDSSRAPDNQTDDKTDGSTSNTGSGVQSDEVSTTTEASTTPAVKAKKRNRRKEKLAERERERARIVQQAQAEADTVPDKRAIELKGMGMMIAKAGLVEHEVQPDGHCLFHSLCDQLDVRCDIPMTVHQLRTDLADYIRGHADEFTPYLIDDETGTVQNIDKYTSDLVNTPMWGGELEIMAASCLFKSPVRVFFASQPPLTINEDRFDKEPFTLAYYQAKFGLGAHYNSLRDASTDVDIDDFE